MDVFIVLKNKFSKKYEIERMTDAQWNTVKNNIDKERIVYITCDINDEALDAYNFKEIIWERIFDDSCNNYRKVKIPFSKNINKVENILNEKRSSIINEIKNREKVFIQKKEKDANGKPRIKISKKLTEEEALIKWYSLECPFPAPSRIVNTKRELGLSWRNLKKYILTELISG